jgi:hypothetical protein
MSGLADCAGIDEAAAAAAEVPASPKEQLLLLTGRHFPLHFQCPLCPWLIRNYLYFI